MLVGVGPDDTPEVARALADKVVDLRIFRDDDGKTNRSLADVAGGVLAVSQFTLFADTSGVGGRASRAPLRLSRPTRCIERSLMRSRHAASTSSEASSGPRCRSSW